MLPLPRDAAADVKLMCGGRPLFRCDLGQAAGHLTVRIEGPAKDRQGDVAAG